MHCPVHSCLEKLEEAGIASHSEPFAGSPLPAEHGKGWLGFGRELQDPHMDNTGSHTHTLFLLTFRLSSSSFYLLSLTLKGISRGKCPFEVFGPQ